MTSLVLPLLVLLVLVVILCVVTYVMSRYSSVYEMNRYPNPQEADFEFKRKCRLRGGVIHLNDAMDPESPFSGTLLACEKRGEFGSPVIVEESEIKNILEKIKSGDPEYNPQTERDRLLLYFKIVYPSAFKGFEDNCCFRKMTESQLQDYYKDLEFYFKLPPEIMPQTKVTIHRSAQQRFYRVPSGVILDQDPERRGIVSRYIEVTRFGTMHALLRNPTLFNGTYYYPAKGSGLFLPLGRSLIAYNKVHAMKLLDTPNEDILKVAGRDFKYFLRKDSAALWRKIKERNPGLPRDQVFKRTCVVEKTREGSSDPGCKPILEANTISFEYIPEALDRIINEMVSGKCLREDYRLRPTHKTIDANLNEHIGERSYKDLWESVDDRDDGTEDKKEHSGRILERQKVMCYYGLGDTGDKMMAQLARDRGYSTMQFLREAQMSLQGDAVVGNELLHLVEPTYSQAYLTRLNPCLNPFYPILIDAPHVNYLLDPKISPVSVQMVTEGEFDPWENHEFKLNVVVPYRA